VLWAVAIFPLGNWTTSWRIDTSRLPRPLTASGGQGAAGALSTQP
jgi:hypothetical protein